MHHSLNDEGAGLEKLEAHRRTASPLARGHSRRRFRGRSVTGHSREDGPTGHPHQGTHMPWFPGAVGQDQPGTSHPGSLVFGPKAGIVQRELGLDANVHKSERLRWLNFDKLFSSYLTMEHRCLNQVDSLWLFLHRAHIPGEGALLLSLLLIIGHY